ncbi:hypothetical protein [Streptomyces sp. CA-111067]|uniref:hypothetical protein n=1 Tax=Streptomyces sp. CA-111067 TaxID=3240046 RepID=UPI003D97D8BC
MRTPTPRSRRFLALALGAASVPALAVTASAAPTDLYAPHAQAAAKVRAAANVAPVLVAAKNIESVTRGTSAGSYCVKVSDPDIDLTNSAVVATMSQNRAMITAIPDPHPWCRNDPMTITVVITDSAGAALDAPFTVAVL